MSISRRQLYAAGETFGDACTRKVAGRVILGGGGGSSSSSSSTTNNSYAIDNRMAIGNGSIGVSGQSTLNYTTVDPGALRAMELSMAASTKSAEAAIAAAKAGEEATAKAAAASAQAQAQTSGQAFSFAAGVDATNKAGFNKLLETGLNLFELNTDALTKAYESTARTQDLTAQAYQQATAEKSGSIDNKTIMVIAVAGAAALVMMRRN